MVEIRNGEDLEKWLEGKPTGWAFGIRWRLGLRLFPLIGANSNSLAPQRYWRSELILRVIQPFISSVFDTTNSYTEHQIKIFRFDANRLRTIDAFVESRFSIRQHVTLRNSIYAVSRIGHFAKLEGIDISRTDVIKVIDEFLWQNRLNIEYLSLFTAISLDATALERGVDLWTQPLWLDDTPEWAVRGWEMLATELTKRAPYWKTLVRWYEDRLHGDDWAAAQGRPAIPELEIARASLPDSYWKKGGKAVNEAIAKLEAYFWNGVPIDDPVLRELVGQAGAVPSGDSFEPINKAEEISDASTPPALPAQSHGPHFGLRDGLLDFAPPDHLDAGKNNIQRLKSLHPLLRSEAQSAIDIFGRNMAHGRIHDALQTYAGLLDGDVTALNYDLIAGIGVKLQSEEAAALTAIADGLEPAFERSETAALKTLLDLHGPFILATEIGQTFVADAERWERNPPQEKQFRQSATKLAEAIEADGIATPATLDFVKTAAADIGLGPQPERSAVFGIGAVRNVSIALVGSAAIYVGASAMMSWDMTHWLSVILITEGIKKSDAGIGVTGLMTDAINDVTRGKALRRIYEFALKHEATLRQLASRRREFSFLIEWLDWLKNGPKK